MYISDLYEDDLEISIKVVIVGNGAVGKSSMIQRYCRGIFTQNYKKTIGVDFLEKHLRVSDEEVRLMLWDTAGQEEFDAITKAYYRGAQACVVAFSTVDRASFEAVRKWKKKVEDECGLVPMVLVQNKIDLLHESQVTAAEVEHLAKELQMRLYRTSVKEDLNVMNVFQHLAENYVSRVKNYSDPILNETSLAFSSLQIGGTHLGMNTANPSRIGPPYVTPNKHNYPHHPLQYQNNNNNNNHNNNPRHHVGSNGNGFVRQTGYPTTSSKNNVNYSRSKPPRYASPQGRSPTSIGGNLSNGFQKHILRRNNDANTFRNNYAHAYHFSPQDYLNNPMFDSLHQNRRYWPSSERTITLRPLGSLAKKNAHKKVPMMNLNSCKVL